MKKENLKIIENKEIAPDMMRMVLSGKVEEVKPGQFINISVPGKFLRRPISICDSEPGPDGSLTIIYKVVGEGTEILSRLTEGEILDVLAPLGNGYDLEAPEIGEAPVLMGGGSGIPPLYYLAKALIERGKDVTVILGFNKEEDIYLEEDFRKIGANVVVTTVDGSRGIKGMVTDAFAGVDGSYFFACGPMPMLKSVLRATEMKGQMSLEARMGCGFGACMGCSIETAGDGGADHESAGEGKSYKRICKDGPVFKRGEIWID